MKRTLNAMIIMVVATLLALPISVTALSTASAGLSSSPLTISTITKSNAKITARSLSGKKLTRYSGSTLIGSIKFTSTTKFTFTVNQGFKWGKLTGTYKVDSKGNIVCSVAGNSLAGGAGEYLRSFTFKPTSNSKVFRYYDGKIAGGDYTGAGLINPGDSFNLK